MNTIRNAALLLIVAAVAIALALSGDNDPDAKPETKIVDPDDSGETRDSNRDELPIQAAAGEWGDLKLRFIYDGAVPAQVKAAIPLNHPDRAFCTKEHPPQEDLVVNPMNKGVANIVVWLYVNRGETAPPAHPDFAKTARAKVRLDNINCRFEPHICVLRTSQTLVVGNKDPMGHNSKADFFSPGNESFNLLVGAKSDSAPLTDKITQAERIPTNISCTIHPWMTARLVVKDHPYVAVSDADGNLLLPKLPAGARTFQVWQEKTGYVSEVTHDSPQADWQSKGRFSVTIKPGENDLGTVMVSPANFK